jgi:hypothetical protein
MKPESNRPFDRRGREQRARCTPPARFSIVLTRSESLQQQKPKQSKTPLTQISLQNRLGWLCPAVQGSKFEVRGSKFGVQYKLSEYNSPSAPPSGRPGGTLEIPWTYPGTIEPSQHPVFDQPGLSKSLSYGVATKSIRAPDSGPEQSEAKPEFSPQNPCSSAFICGSLLHIDPPQYPTPTR